MKSTIALIALLALGGCCSQPRREAAASNAVDCARLKAALSQADAARASAEVIDQSDQTPESAAALAQASADYAAAQGDYNAAGCTQKP